MVLYIDLNAGRIYSTSLPLWLSILAQEQLYVRAALREKLLLRSRWTEIIY